MTSGSNQITAFKFKSLTSVFNIQLNISLVESGLLKSSFENLYLTQKITLQIQLECVYIL